MAQALLLYLPMPIWLSSAHFSFAVIGSENASTRDDSWQTRWLGSSSSVVRIVPTLAYKTFRILFIELVDADFAGRFLKVALGHYLTNLNFRS
jgi:hypothetical protein